MLSFFFYAYIAAPSVDKRNWQPNDMQEWPHKFIRMKHRKNFFKNYNISAKKKFKVMLASFFKVSSNTTC